ncbi:MAG: selenium cofactor biosynthesis protein YqeC [Acidimicrobiales bacterium]
MAEPVALEDLSEALGIGDSEHIALVGGGGKSTLLHALGRQLAGSRILTTTTKMGRDQHEGLQVLLSPAAHEAIEAAQKCPVIVWSSISGKSALGVDPQDCDSWVNGVDYIIVEADGARMRPFKAPNPREPVVPSKATLMLSVIGSDALGQAIEEQCHRPQLVAELAGCQIEDPLTPERAAEVILHSEGAVGKKPQAAKLAVVITKVTGETRSLAEELAARLERRVPGLLVVLVKLDR